MGYYTKNFIHYIHPFFFSARSKSITPLESVTAIAAGISTPASAASQIRRIETPPASEMYVFPFGSAMSFLFLSASALFEKVGQAFEAASPELDPRFMIEVETVLLFLSQIVVEADAFRAMPYRSPEDAADKPVIPGLECAVDGNGFLAGVAVLRHVPGAGGSADGTVVFWASAAGSPFDLREFQG